MTAATAIRPLSAVALPTPVEVYDIEGWPVAVRDYDAWAFAQSIIQLPLSDPHVGEVSPSTSCRSRYCRPPTPRSLLARMRRRSWTTPTASPSTWFSPERWSSWRSAWPLATRAWIRLLDGADRPDVRGAGAGPSVRPVTATTTASAAGTRGLPLHARAAAGAGTPAKGIVVSPGNGAE